MIKLSKNLDEAAMMLYPFRDPLDPRTGDEFRHYYVDRTHRDTKLKDAVKTAHFQKVNFQWFYTGHTGSGKSTELFRFLADPEVEKVHLALYINLEKEYGKDNIKHTDIILSLARAAVSEAKRLRLKLPRDLDAYIDLWNKEVFQETTKKIETEGAAGVKLDVWVAKLGEEIRSGGGKSETIRVKMYNDITKFIHLVDQATELIDKKAQKRVLFVVDGLDHLDPEPCREMFFNHFITLCRPQASSLFVIPLSLVRTDFAINIQGRCSIVPNIKVFQDAGSEALDPGGLEFYKNLISRFAPLTFFTDEALRSLFRLSAGILRDMIRLTGNACRYADNDSSAVVEDRHAQQVWNEEIAFFRGILGEADFPVLERINDNPHPKGLDEVPQLIFRKAVIFYPNGEGWYGVHPAVQRILEQ